MSKHKDLFNFRDILRILRNMRSPYIDEANLEADVEEFYSLWAIQVVAINLLIDNRTLFIQHHPWRDQFLVMFNAWRRAIVQEIRWMFNAKQEVRFTEGLKGQ